MDKENERRNTPEYKAKVEEDLKKIWDEGVEKLNKYIK